MNAQQLILSWLDGRASLGPDQSVRFADLHAPGLAERFRRAYDWIAENALIAPYHDIDLGTPLLVGRGEGRVELPHSASYSSFVLLPLLNLVAARRVVFVGGPGRGKTTMATLMALLAGAPLAEVRRAVQHGHPQLTLADLLGGPLPGDLVRAERGQDIHVLWRSWITARVKIIDEYNRIPTKTQSALLSLMAEGYAEMYEQVVHSGRSAWYLTANDDQGGGTFPVIEALRDRIDLVVRCTPFHPRFLDTLAERVAGGRAPEEFVPADLVCTAAELDEADRAVRAVHVPPSVREVLGSLLGQLDFCLRASDRLEFRTKDTLHLAGRFLMHYVGGGTAFPFGLLGQSVSECRAAQPVRVVISDGDFHHNYHAAAGNAGIFADAARVSPHFLLMLHATEDVGGAYGRAGARVLTVAELEDYPTMAAALAAALFEGESHGAR